MSTNALSGSSLSIKESRLEKSQSSEFCPANQTMTIEQFLHFLNAEHRDSRLNEILYPRYDMDQVRKLINCYEMDKDLSSKGEAWSLY